MESRADKFVYLDIDINSNRENYARAAAFVEANDIKYNFSSKNIAELGGRELLSVPDMYAMDYDWSTKGPVSIAPQSCCRIIIKLFEEACPLTCQNFESLITGACGKAKGSGVPLHYKNAIFHRIIPRFIAQGGDYVMNNGTGGESIWGKKFKDEKNGLKLKHHKAGMVSMCNSGKNSNGSQFFFTFRACPQLDGRHVVFGEVIHGHEVLQLMQNVDCVDGEPQQRVCITECGIWRNPADPNSMATQGHWSPTDVFVEADTNLSKEREGGAFQLNFANMHAFIFASKAPVNERFRISLADIGIKSTCIASPEELGSLADPSHPRCAEEETATQRFVVVAPGEEATDKENLKTACELLNIRYVSCKPSEVHKHASMLCA